MQTKLTHHHLTTEAVNDERASEDAAPGIGPNTTAVQGSLL
jgi:hypothetical protein